MLSEPGQARIKKSTFTISGASPWHVDLTTIFEDNDESAHTLAIFEISQDEMRYCVAPPGRARPEKFATQSGDGLTLVVLKRAIEKSNP